jgi:hypothetical protein
MTETMLAKMWGTTRGQMRKLEENGGFPEIADRAIRRKSLTANGRGGYERLFRNQQVGGSSPLAGSKSYNNKTYMNGFQFVLRRMTCCDAVVGFKFAERL